MKLLRDSLRQILLTLLALIILAIASALLNLFSKYLAALWAAATALAAVYTVWKPSGNPTSVGRAGGAVMAATATLLSLGIMAAPSDAERLAVLRNSDPAAYLASIREADQALWLKELEALDPAKFTAEMEILALVEADKTKVEQAERLATETAAHAASIAAEKAAVAEAIAETDKRAASFEALKASTLSAIQDQAWSRARSQILSARSKFAEEYAAAQPGLEAAILTVIKPSPASDLAGNRAAYELLALINPDVPEYGAKAEDYAAKQAEARLLPLKNMVRKEDKVEGVTWYKHPNQPKYTNSRSTVYLYIGQRPGKKPFLRMVVQYTASDWLFVEEVYAWHEVPSIPGGLKELLISGPFERDNNSTIWEWRDVTPDPIQLSTLRLMAGSSEAILRFVGAQYTNDVVLSAKDKRAISDVLDAFDALNLQ